MTVRRATPSVRDMAPRRAQVHPACLLTTRKMPLYAEDTTRGDLRP